MTSSKSHPTFMHRLAAADVRRCGMVDRVGGAVGATLIVAIALVSTAGCYDAKALVEQVRSQALKNRLHEVDLGTFRTTMPSDPDTQTFTKMEMHLFGTVPRYRIPDVQRELKANRYRLRHETLAAVRQTTPEELADPDLNQLRDRLAGVVNGVFDKAPIKSVGFEAIRILHE